MKKKYQSEILEVLHGMAEDLHEIGVINDKRMAEYDRDCTIQKKAQTYNTGTIDTKPITPALAKK